MVGQTVAALQEQADAQLFARQYTAALDGYLQITSQQPGNLDARLRIADALMAMGELQRAAVVYTALARHAALAGYPLRSLVALKMLSALEPRLGVLLHDFAGLYARNSPRLGKSVRRALPDPNDPLSAPTPPARSPDALAVEAERVASNYDTAGLVYPEKLIPLPLFSLLDAHEFGAVLEALRLLRVRPGTVILREGEPGTRFFVLARGHAHVSSLRGGETKHLGELLEAAIFGEMALLSAAPRTATITAHSECDLLEFDCGALSHASSTLANLAGALSGFARERLLRNVVTTSPLFGPLDSKQRMDLMRRFVAVDAAAGSVVIREGEPGVGLYVLLRGNVNVTRAGIDIAHLGPGEMFGEISLIQGEATTATVTAEHGGASLLFLSRDYFERLLQAVPELRAYLERLTEERLMDQRISLAPGDSYGDSVPPDDAGEMEIEIEP